MIHILKHGGTNKMGTEKHKKKIACCFSKKQRSSGPQLLIVTCELNYLATVFQNVGHSKCGSLHTLLVCIGRLWLISGRFGPF